MCDGSCNTFFGGDFVPNKVKNINVKIFNLISVVN